MDESLRKKILEANVNEHAKEASIYDEVHPEIFRADAQRRVVRLLNDASEAVQSGGVRALDLGCGTGNVTEHLLQHRYQIDAVDLSPEMVEMLKKKIGSGEGRVRTFVSGADEFLADKKETYDLIVTSSLLHHLPDYRESVRAMIRALKPGGVIVHLHEPSGEKLPKVFGRLAWADAVSYNIFFLPWKAKKKVFSIDYEYTDYHVEHGFHLSHIEDELNKAGMDLLSTEKYNALKLRPTTWALDHLTRFRLEFSLIARKPSK